MGEQIEQKNCSGAFVVAVTSGKKGVGKTSGCVNLSVALAASGSRVCILDADTDQPNISSLLDLSTQRTMERLIKDDLNISELLQLGPSGLQLVSGASGLVDFLDFETATQDRLLHALRILERHFDYLLIDTAAGINRSTLAFLRASPDLLLVISPDPTSLTDAFSLLRVLKTYGGGPVHHVLVSQAKNQHTGLELFRRFQNSVERYLNVSLNYLGFLPQDAAVDLASKKPVTFLRHGPTAAAIRVLMQSMAELHGLHLNSKRGDAFSTYWDRLRGGEPLWDFSAPVATLPALKESLNVPAQPVLTAAVLPAKEKPERLQGLLPINQTFCREGENARIVDDQRAGLMAAASTAALLSANE